MRTTLLVLLLLCPWSTSAWAKTIKIPKGTVSVNQLHDELLTKVPAWRGTPQPNGTFVNPLLQVEFSNDDVTLTVPDQTDEAVVQAMVKTHKPKPPKDHKTIRQSAKKKLKDLGLTQDEVDATLSD